MWTVRVSMWKNKVIHAIPTKQLIFKILKNCTFTSFKKAFRYLVPSKILLEIKNTY